MQNGQINVKVNPAKAGKNLWDACEELFNVVCLAVTGSNIKKTVVLAAPMVEGDPKTIDLCNSLVTAYATGPDAVNKVVLEQTNLDQIVPDVSEDKIKKGNDNLKAKKGDSKQPVLKKRNL